jgi:ribosome-associated protein
MADDVALSITERLQIPSDELRYRFSRAGGPGGQHVNRSATQVELLFDVAHSPSLSEEQRSRIQSALGTRIDQEGVLHLFSRGTRSQLRNRGEVTARFQALLRRALQPPKPRRPTRPSAASRERRIEAKKRQSKTKRERAPVTPEENP